MNLRNFARIALLAGVAGLAFGANAPAQAADKHLTILASVPDMAFPFFVHMMQQLQGGGGEAGLTVLESDGQVSSPKQTADIEAALAKGVNGIVLRPNEVDAMAPALQEAVDASMPVVTVDRRVPKVTGILAHVGADNVKGGEAQGESCLKLFPNGANDVNLQGQSGASPGDRPQQGPAQRDRQGRRQIQDRVRADGGFRPRQGSVGHRSGARRHEASRPTSSSAANDDMALGAMEAVKARGLYRQDRRSSGSTRCPKRSRRSATAVSPRRSSSSPASRAGTASTRSPPSSRRQEAGAEDHCCSRRSRSPRTT